MAFQQLQDMERRIEDAGERERLMFAFITEVIAPSVKTNIRVGGRPPFAPLAPFTVFMKQLKGQPLQPGIATGHMYQSLTPGGPDNIAAVTPDSVTYGTSAPGAYSFEHGLKENHQPARPFLLLQPEDLNAMGEMYNAWLTTGAT